MSEYRDEDSNFKDNPYHVHTIQEVPLGYSQGERWQGYVAPVIGIVAVILLLCFG